MYCSRRLLISVLPIVLFTLAPAASHAQERLQVGEHYAFEDLTPRDYRGVTGVTAESRWAYQLTHEGATYIAIHFVEFDLGPGDYLLISDPQDGQAYTLQGKGKMEAGTFWAQHIKGDTAVLELFVVGQDGGRGFAIDEYVGGFVDLGNTTANMAICPPDDKENAICYENSHPIEYERGRAVARLLISGSGLCTGWLASPLDHLITNDHCIESASDALNTDYEFMSQAPSCSSSNCQLCYPGTVYSGGSYVQASGNLDYALVQIFDGNPAADYGYLQIDNRDAIVGEQIYILQHPGGRAKEFAIFSTHANDPDGDPLVYSVTSPPCTGGGYFDVGYFADTEGGSSGSPVLATSSHKVIALHHCANCPNRGVPIDLVFDEIGGFLGPFPPNAEDLEASTAVSTPATFTLVASDDGLPSPPAAMTFTISRLPSHGELSDPGNGPITTAPYTLVGFGSQVDYQPETDYSGPDSFDFTADDGGTPPNGGVSNTALVSITVGGPDWDPVANDMNWSTAVSVPGDITLWGSDPNSDPLTYIIESLPTQGSLSDPGAGPIVTVPYTVVGGGNGVTYTPPPAQPLQETFDYSVRDATAGSSIGTVTVTVGGPMWDPVAQDMDWGTAVSLPSDIPLSASDPNGDPLTYHIQSLPDAGGLSDPGAGPINTVPYTLVAGGGTVTYTPPYGQMLQTTFNFSVTDATAASNVATVTVDVGAPHAVYSFLMDADPGWGTAGQWAFGQPTGGGSHAGDPTSGYTGNNVFGYNLGGDYEHNMPLRYLTSGPIDCTFVQSAELRFRRWLGVESSFFDHANIQISTNGLMWTTLWDHDGATIDEASWSLQTFDISSIADNQPAIFLRWGMGPTDSTAAYAGWNLDDVLIWGLDTTPVPLPCDDLTYTPGDVNLDGTADGADVRTLVQMLLNPLGAWSPEQLCAADFTGDDAVTLADVDAFVLELLN